MDAIKLIFDRLDDWRHLPSYQLERRADIFFAIYLRDFLQDHLKVSLRPQLVPEFPLHLKTLGFGSANNQSVKVDYVAVSEDLTRVFLIELKTDMASFRDKQFDYLKLARDKGIHKLLDGILQICRATQSRAKYVHLLRLLDAIGMIALPTNQLDVLPSKGKVDHIDFDKLPKDIVRIPECKPEILYLQPYLRSCDNSENTIGFDKFADWLLKFGDPFSVRFRHSLQTWHDDAKRNSTVK